MFRLCVKRSSTAGQFDIRGFTGYPTHGQVMTLCDYQSMTAYELLLASYVLRILTVYLLQVSTMGNLRTLVTTISTPCYWPKGSGF